MTIAAPQLSTYLRTCSMFVGRPSSSHVSFTLRSSAVTCKFPNLYNFFRHLFVPTLSSKADLSGFFFLYLACGAEETSTILSYGLYPSTVDTISTVKVICSVPALGRTRKSLYSFLLPGGQWLVYGACGCGETVSAFEVLAEYLPDAVAMAARGGATLIGTRSRV